MQCFNPFCLSESFCSEWDSCSGMEPPAKKSKPDSTLSRFSESCSSAEMQVICQGYIPKNTRKATTWALKVFKAWREQRAKEKDRKCPEDLLDSPKVEPLNLSSKHAMKTGSHILRSRSTTFCPAFISTQNLRHLAMKLYRKSGNFCCQNIFVVTQGYKNKFREIFCTTNN